MSIQPIAFTPQNPLLQEHISYYYFLRTDDTFESTYIAFPHTHTVLNIHHEASAQIDGYCTKVMGSAHAKPMLLAQGIRNKPMLVQLQGKLDKVTILFKPLGINHFHKAVEKTPDQRPSFEFTAWDQLPELKRALSEFYDCEDLNQRITVLEDLLLNLYQVHEPSVRLQHSVDILQDFNQEVSIPEIAAQLNLTTKTFTRLFTKHLGVPPITYRKIARFRHSLQQHQLHVELTRITDLAYQSNYYDQAYFNKIYRSLTGNTPKAFFKTIEKLADDQLILQFT